jgi:LSD1 subclass zinc finger protein
MASVLQLALICRGCRRPFTANPGSPAARDVLCFWCWLPRVKS